MASLQLNPRALANDVGMLKTTAAARIASAVAQRLSPTTIRKVQQLLSGVDFVEGLLGLDDITDTPQPLLGGVSLRQAREIYEQIRDAQLARKNLFFVRVIDYNPPPIEYADGYYFTSLFNLFAVDVSYAPSTLQGEKVPLGSAALDRVTGYDPTDMTVTTFDDSRGSLKRWFDAKVEQAVHADGTFGLPSEYWLDIEVYHATPEANENAYKVSNRMRCVSIQHELSRRDQALSELAMAFTQFDTFLRP